MAFHGTNEDGESRSRRRWNRKKNWLKEEEEDEEEGEGGEEEKFDFGRVNRSGGRSSLLPVVV